MKFYLNQRGLFKCSSAEIDTCINEIHLIYKKMIENKSTLYVQDNIYSHPKILELYSEPHKYYTFFALLKQIEQIQCCSDEEYGQITITPIVTCEIAIGLFKVCIRDDQQYVITSTNDTIITNSSYNLRFASKNMSVTNLIGDGTIDNFLLHNPMCSTINDVFNKVEGRCPNIKFTQKAYMTASERDFSYRNYRFDLIIDMFMHVEKLLLPYFRGEIACSEKEIIKQFKEKTGIEFSQESNATMQKYGHEREMIIDGDKYTFTFHFKIGDNRIYFIYMPVKDKIFIGHAGGHLSIVSY